VPPSTSASLADLVAKAVTRESASDAKASSWSYVRGLVAWDGPGASWSDASSVTQLVSAAYNAKQDMPFTAADVSGYHRHCCPGCESPCLQR